MGRLGTKTLAFFLLDDRFWVNESGETTLTRATSLPETTNEEFMPQFAFKTLAERRSEMPYPGISVRDHNAIAYRFPYDTLCNHIAREINGEWKHDIRSYVFRAHSAEQVEAIIVGLRRLNEAVELAKARNEAGAT